MTDPEAIEFALQRTSALRRAYGKAAVSALADHVLYGKRLPGKLRLALRAMKATRKGAKHGE